MWATWIWSLDQEDPLKKEMETYSSILPGEFHGQRNLEGNSPWGCKESDTTGWLSLHFLILYTIAYNIPENPGLTYFMICLQREKVFCLIILIRLVILTFELYLICIRAISYPYILLCWYSFQFTVSSLCRNLNRISKSALTMIKEKTVLTWCSCCC